MGLSTLDRALWAAGFIGHVVLFTILVLRRRWREFLVFVTLIGFYGLRTILLYSVYMYQNGSWACYSRIYYGCAIVDFVLQLGVVWEIARIVMRPIGSWVEDAKTLFISGGVVAVLFAAALTWMTLSPGPNLFDDLIIRRSSLFMSLVVCELFVVMVITSKWLGLGFRHHVFALVIGWWGWVIVSLAVDTLHGYYGNRLHFEGLEYVRKTAYLGAIVYWVVQFWQNEPARKPIPDELKQYLEDLRRQIENDIDTIDGHR